MLIHGHVNDQKACRTIVGVGGSVEGWSATRPLFKIVSRKNASKWFQSLLRKSYGTTTFFAEFVAQIYAQLVATLVHLLLTSAPQLMRDAAGATLGICGIHQRLRHGRANDDVTWGCSLSLSLSLGQTWATHLSQICGETSPELKAESSVRQNVVHVWAVGTLIPILRAPTDDSKGDVGCGFWGAQWARAICRECTGTSLNHADAGVSRAQEQQLHHQIEHG